jgi:hypothetical protein
MVDILSKKSKLISFWVPESRACERHHFVSLRHHGLEIMGEEDKILEAWLSPVLDGAVVADGSP